MLTFITSLRGNLLQVHGVIFKPSGFRATMYFVAWSCPDAALDKFSIWLMAVGAGMGEEQDIGTEAACGSY